jgi:hypothetical protein
MPEKSKTSFNAGSVPFLPYGYQAFLATARLQAHTFKSMMNYQIEALSFLKRRCEQDVKFVDDLAATEELSDAFDLCAGFYQNAISEYSDEAGKIVDLGSKIAADTAKQVQREAENVAEATSTRSVA